MASTLKRRFVCWLLFVGLALLLLLLGTSVATIRAAVRVGRYRYSADCGPPQPYLIPRSADQALFTARVLYVGRVDAQYATRSGHRFGLWGIAYVKHRYWGLPWWSSYIVALGPGWYQQGGTYFIDGDWPGDSKFLPVVVTRPCRRTQPLSEAVVDTRILSNVPSRHGVRIIGRTYRRNSERQFEPAPGIRVEIDGPNGSVFVTSDADAVYDFTGLSAGNYSTQIQEPDRRNCEEGPQEKDLSIGEVWERSVYSK